MASHVAQSAAELDARDPLARFREQFYIPHLPDVGECTYLCGHSLGLQPKNVRAYVEQELRDWAELGVEAHFRAQHPWMPYHRYLAEPMARIVGAEPSEVVVMNSLTANLHFMLVSFYRPAAQRHKIIVERGAFPSDQYAVKSQIQFHGFDPATSLVELAPRPGEFTLREEDIFTSIDREGASTALVLLGGINYSTGQFFDLPAITRVGHARGCVVGFDLAHAAGNVPLRLHDWNADFAVWCSYKYLNGGPGCVGGCFVHQRHARDTGLPRFAGWWGHDEQSRFRMGPDFHPMPGAEGWQVSNAPILSMASLRASLDLFEDAGIEALRAKSIALTGYMESLLQPRASDKFSIITPADPPRRGAQLSLYVPHNGRAICDRLATEGILCDFREPGILRAAPAPLYNTFADVQRFVDRFTAAL